eukprot:3557572-Prymnesium_polylepis.2
MGMTQDKLEKFDELFALLQGATGVRNVFEASDRYERTKRTCEQLAQQCAAHVSETKNGDLVTRHLLAPCAQIEDAQSSLEDSRAEAARIEAALREIHFLASAPPASTDKEGLAQAEESLAEAEEKLLMLRTQYNRLQLHKSEVRGCARSPTSSHRRRMLPQHAS